MSWYLGPLAAFDTETTGINRENDRIVSAAVWLHGGDEPDELHCWTADPGIEVPTGASNIHGLTTEHVRTHGRPAAEVLAEVSALLAKQIVAGTPLVIMNAPFDLTLLDRELRQHGLPSLLEQAGWQEPLVVDPLVLDRAVDKYRKGRRTLTDLCAHYGVTLGQAHEAAADAMAALRVSVEIAERHPQLRVGAAGLHLRQEYWAREQAASYQRHLRAKGRADAVVDGRWPMIPYEQDGGAK